MPDARYAAVGGFVLAGLAIAVAAILFFGGKEAFAPKDKAVAFFEGSVGGLGPGSPVTFRGVRVGSVSGVGLVLDPMTMRSRIPVRLTLDPNRVTVVGGTAGAPMLRSLIEAGLRAKLEPESLVTGQMLVELDMRPDVSANVAGWEDLNVPEIPSMQSDLQMLKNQLTHAPLAETVIQAKRTLVSMERVANRVSTVIDPLAENAGAVLISAARVMDVADEAVSSVRSKAEATLEDARGLASDARQQLDARAQEVSRALTATEKAMQSARGLLASADSLVSRGSRPRDDIESTLRDLSASASALRDLLQTADRDPSVVLRGRTSR